MAAHAGLSADADLWPSRTRYRRASAPPRWPHPGVTRARGANGLRQPIHAADLAAALRRLLTDPPPDANRVLQRWAAGERLSVEALLRRVLAAQ
ncbi:MAG: hypothetical protein U5L11_12855 [Arhodomonas sp.]|nr:hypothetical protein [Arhodomonas sp.]